MYTFLLFYCLSSCKSEKQTCFFNRKVANENINYIKYVEVNDKRKLKPKISSKENT